MKEREEKTKKKINIKNKKGITLIALVITIIVLLILAGVSIAMLTGNNGILTQASNAKEEQSHGAVREGIALLYNEYQIKIRTGSNIKLASTEDVQVQEVTEESRITFLGFLTGKNESNINYTKSGSDEEGYVLDVEKLTGSKQSLGNGTTEDIYKIEDDGMNYKITYYETEETLLEISTITKDESEQDPFKYTQADIDETLKYLDYDLNTGTINGVLNEYYNNGYSPTIDIPIEKVVIPSEINGHKVEMPIGEKSGFTGGHTNACFGNVKTVIFLNENEMPSFTDCEALENIKLPSKLTYIGNQCFSGCSNLKNVIMPDMLEIIGNYAFADCTSLEELTIPSSVTSIGNNAFENCPNLTITVEAGSKLTKDDFENTGIDLSKVIFEDEEKNEG